MKDELFDTKEKRELAIANLITLKATAGWILVLSILDANIEVLKEQILNGIDNETKEEIDRKRDLLKAYKNLRDTPDMIVKQLTAGETEIPNLDPFQTVTDLRKDNGSA